MEVVREVEVDAEPGDVWSALTEAAQLEEWFANEVELDPTPGGRGVFRWDNGETREAVVESVEEGERIVLRFDDDGIVDLRVVPVEGGTVVQVREAAPSWSTALEFMSYSVGNRLQSVLSYSVGDRLQSVPHTGSCTIQ